MPCLFFPPPPQELAGIQAQLAEASTLKQRLEEGLRQRERELTALKGVLKDEVASHDRDVESLREQYSTDMEKLRGSMEQVSQVQSPPLHTHACTHARARIHTHTGVWIWKAKRVKHLQIVKVY